MTAESKEAALAVLQEEKPLLIVMDVHLGEMDGLELTRELRAHCWAEGIPILLVSSLYKHLTKTEAQAVGARDFLQLPEELGSFGKRIALLIEQIKREPTSAPCDPLAEE